MTKIRKNIKISNINWYIVHYKITSHNFLKDNNSFVSKYKALISVLQEHFKIEPKYAKMKLICLFIIALYKIKIINFEGLASGSDKNLKNRNSYKRMQRFMKDYDFHLIINSTLIFKLLHNKND